MCNVDPFPLKEKKKKKKEKEIWKTRIKPFLLLLLLLLPRDEEEEEEGREEEMIGKHSRSMRRAGILSRTAPSANVPPLWRRQDLWRRNRADDINTLGCCNRKIREIC